MTETGQESVVEEEKIPLPPGRGEDYFLQDLVELANMGVGIGVTLVCGGTLVSGVVLSGKQYFESVINDVIGVADLDDVMKKAIQARFSSYLPIYDGAENPSIDRPPPAFIHLRNTTFHGPGGGTASNQGVLWRGRISEVDGFWFGNYGVK